MTPSTNSWYCKKYSYFFQNRSNSICKDVFGNDHLYYWRGWNYSEADNSLRRAFDALVPLVRRLLPSMQGQGVIATAKRFGNSYGPLFEKEFANITIPTLAQYDRCVKVVRPYACYETFETCDFSGRYPKAKYLCREACEFIQDGVCKEEVRLARIVDRIKRKSPEAFNFNPYVITIKYCYQYPRKKPGNADKCLIPDYFLGKPSVCLIMPKKCIVDLSPPQARKTVSIFLRNNNNFQTIKNISSTSRLPDFFQKDAHFS